MHFSLAFLLAPLVLILPLGLDTLGVSLSLGMKSASRPPTAPGSISHGLPLWLRTAILFALAEMLMPIVGLLIGAVLASLISGLMHYIGALLLIALGLWELLEEGREHVRKRTKRVQNAPSAELPSSQPAAERFQWGPQLLLALSVSLDELAVGFSFGSLKNIPFSPAELCILIGLQGLLMALVGLALGRALRFRLKMLKEWCELLSAALLIGLGVWFIFA